MAASRMNVSEMVEQALLAFEESGTRDELPASLLDDLTEVVNEYDRMLGTVRLELLAKASDYLDHLMALAASGKAGDPTGVLRPAPVGAVPLASV